MTKVEHQTQRMAALTVLRTALSPGDTLFVVKIGRVAKVFVPRGEGILSLSHAVGVLLRRSDKHPDSVLVPAETTPTAAGEWIGIGISQAMWGRGSGNLFEICFL